MEWLYSIITGLIAVLGSLIGVTKILARNAKKNGNPGNFSDGEKIANYFAEVKEDTSKVKSSLDEIIRTLGRIEEKITK